MDPGVVQARISGSCATGEAVSGINADGTVSCASVSSGGGGGGSSVTAGSGLALSGAELSVDYSATQRRLIEQCISGYYMRAIAEDGTITCEKSDTSSSFADLYLTDGSSDQWRFGVLSNNWMFLATATGSSALVVVTEAGDVGIGTAPGYKMQVAGTIGVAGMVVTSDVRSKREIERLSLGHGARTLAQLSPVRFKYRANFTAPAEAENVHLGFLAHEVAAVVPEAVRSSGDGIQGVSYHALVPLLVDAVQRLQDEVLALRAAVGLPRPRPSLFIE